MVVTLIKDNCTDSAFVVGQRNVRWYVTLYIISRNYMDK